jgi:hypothetical protein
MAHILNISTEDPIIHIKAYGGVQIEGLDRAEVQCEINAPQLATLVEEDGHVYVTVNSSCSLKVPMSSSIEIEKGMGSIKISHIKNKIQIEKALGNLVLIDISEATIEKVGGNFAVRKASGRVSLEKVGGNLIVEDVDSFSCEKIGGACYARDVRGDFSLQKAGGGFRAQDIGGVTVLTRVGGSFIARGVIIGDDIRAGGDISLKDFDFSQSDLSFKAGGDIKLEISEDFPGSTFELSSGGEDIRVKINDDDLDIDDYNFIYKFGEGDRTLEVASGGAVFLSELTDVEDDLVGDLSDYFSHEESKFSEMIQERIESATRIAEAKVKAAEIRLEKMRERVEKHRGLHVDLEFGDKPEQPVQPMARKAGRKGASDEERLMILKMLQEKKITVDEAETLFKALED